MRVWKVLKTNKFKIKLNNTNKMNIKTTRIKCLFPPWPTIYKYKKFQIIKNYQKAVKWFKIIIIYNYSF